MKVVLAGYNVDREALDEVRRAAPARLDLTPETLSASYARISRDARPVDELRRAARAEVDKARRSNRAIIFKMGHHSVAEHAVFNFDVMGVSRLAIEEIEKFRLGSYTEKSQRYITLGSDFVVPAEIVATGRRELSSIRSRPKMRSTTSSTPGCGRTCSSASGPGRRSPKSKFCWKVGPRKTPATPSACPPRDNWG